MKSRNVGWINSCNGGINVFNNSRNPILKMISPISLEIFIVKQVKAKKSSLDDYIKG